MLINDSDTILSVTKNLSTCRTLADALSVSKQVLLQYQSNLTYNEPIVEAKILLENVLNKSALQLISHSDALLSERDKKNLTAALLKRISGYPVAYIVGHQAFWTLQLKVSEHTLIPRADSETVVETALSLPLPSTANILDLGTGTGAIALAIKSEKSQWEVTACDFKPEIVELAKHNARHNNLSVNVILSDWFCAVPKTGFDLIVSNPPYVENGSHWLEQGDVRFEPDSALTSGMDGLDDIRHIICNSVEYLNEGAYLLLEHGHEQAGHIRQLLRDSGFIELSTKQDLNMMDRVTIGRYKHPGSC